MALSCHWDSWDSDDEYEKFIHKMNPPRVVIDSDACADATVIRVDSANKYGILLDVVQVLTDLDLIINKAYISSDGGWFMDVFNVTDKDGKKLNDEATLDGIADYIRKSLGADSSYVPSRRRSVGVAPSLNYTSIELTGTDRPGLLSEVSAVLTNLKCSTINAEVWTHNTRAAAVMQVTDEETGSAITDTERLSRIRELLCNVLKGNNKIRGAKTSVSTGATHTERRLHQMMFDDRDYQRCDQTSPIDNTRPNVTVDWCEKGYTVITIRSRDRPKLLFDTICTLTDMQYVVYHGNVDNSNVEAYQEYYIRHVDGSPVNSEAERERVIQCLEAAIERRVSEQGLKLELCTNDRVGLLSDVTRIFRENSLNVTRAEVSTKGGKVVNTFYVRCASGNQVDARILDSIRQSLGQKVLEVKGQDELSNSKQETSPTRFLFGGLFRSKSLYNLCW